MGDSLAGPAAPRHQPRTRRARAAVVTAARNLFESQGYTATSIGQISNSAGVPPASVYRLFTSKVGILKAVLDVAIAGDDEDSPVAARPAVQHALAEPLPTGRIAAFVAVTSAINARIAAIYSVLTNAADADPEARELLAQLDEQRGRGQRMLADSLARSDSLREGLTANLAADILHALMSPELYRMLVVERKWTPNSYSQWLSSALVGQLIDH